MVYLCVFSSVSCRLVKERDDYDEYSTTTSYVLYSNRSLLPMVYGWENKIKEIKEMLQRKHSDSYSNECELSFDYFMTDQICQKLNQFLPQAHFMVYYPEGRSCGNGLSGGDCPFEIQLSV